MTVQFDIGATMMVQRLSDGVWVSIIAKHPGAVHPSDPSHFIVADPANAQRLVYAMNKAEEEEREARTLADAVRQAKQEEAIAKWCVPDAG